MYTRGRGTLQNLWWGHGNSINTDHSNVGWSACGFFKPLPVFRPNLTCDQANFSTLSLFFAFTYKVKRMGNRKNCPDRRLDQNMRFSGYPISDLALSSQSGKKSIHYFRQAGKTYPVFETSIFFGVAQTCRELLTPRGRVPLFKILQK